MRIKITALILLCAMLFSACAAPAADKSYGGDGAQGSSQTDKSSQPGETAEPSEPAQSSRPADESAAPDRSAPPEEQDGGEDGTDTPEPSAEIPDEMPAAADLSQLEGRWFMQDSFGILDVDDNGAFTYTDSSGTWKGTLVYTEEDGGMWETGPRYDMYLESGDRLYGSSRLAFDAGEPESLVYGLGGGAELMGRYVPDFYRDCAVTVMWGRDAEPYLEGYNVYENGSEDSVQVAFFANRPLKSFRLLDLFLQDVDEDGNIDYLYTERYVSEGLEPSAPLLADTVFYGDLPNNGISYIDWDGSERYFALSQSGEDGSLQLTEF